MNSNSILKKEGIEIIKSLDILQTNKIANSIANKLCEAFPEHGFDKKILFSNLARLNMYIAKMPSGLSLAKYFSEEQAIYFSENSTFDDFDTIAMHECIHFLQDSKTICGNLNRLGLATFSKKVEGLALNEAAVQLMASDANKCKKDDVTYYGICLPTTSPNHYTLECVLVREMAYFTGSYPLYHSTLFSNDIFKNTFIAKSSKNVFNTIQSNLDKLVHLEDILCEMSNDLLCSNTEVRKVRKINTAISKIKNEIFNLFFKTQNLITTACFDFEFNSIRTFDDLAKFKTRLYQFQYCIGTNPEYTFYSDFYYYTMTQFEKKQEYIEKHAGTLLAGADCMSITLFENNSSMIAFFRTFWKKIRKLGILRQKSVSKNID